MKPCAMGNKCRMSRRAEDKWLSHTLSEYPGSSPDIKGVPLRFVYCVQ